MQYIIVLFLLSCSALFSGLTLGLMGLNVFELQRKMKLGDRRAARVYPIRKRGNELLTALLLGNVAVNSMLAIFLGDLASGAVAGLMATVLIFLFGEIIPQATISRYGLQFGAASAPLMRVLLFVMSPITKPVAWTLNYFLGEELPTIYSKKELALFIDEHEGHAHESIDSDERRIIQGALHFSTRTTRDVLTPRTVVYMLEANKEITPELLQEIKTEAYSRIPLFEKSKDNVVGFVHTRDLIGVTSGRMSDFSQDILTALEADTLDDIKNLMLSNKQHVAAVMSEFGGFVGLITLEDILEEVIGREILDEEDEAPDLREVARSNAREKLGRRKDS